MKILHVNNQASVGYLLSRSQRKLGHKSDLLAMGKRGQRKPDFTEGSVKSLFIRLLKLMPSYELIHLHGGIGISGLGLAPFKASGKRFFAHYHGSELREGIQTSFHRIAERIFVSTPDLLKLSDRVGGRELIHIPNPVHMGDSPVVDYNKRLESIRERGYLIVSHLPSLREVKGTDNVLKGVEEAREKGASLKLDIIENRPPDEAMSRLERSDICIDWMSPGYDIHGVVSVEAMVRGIPAICNIDRALYPEEIPIIDCGPEQLGEKLFGIWSDPDGLVGISERSREYALKYHHPDSVAEMMERYL